MKAVDYYEKYTPILSDKKAILGRITQLHKLFIEFSDEVVKLYNDRHCNSSEALVSIISEQNQKWNLLSRIFEKRDGLSYLKKDGFKEYWTYELQNKSLPLSKDDQKTQLMLKVFNVEN